MKKQVLCAGTVLSSLSYSFLTKTLKKVPVQSQFYRGRSESLNESVKVTQCSVELGVTPTSGTSETSE